MWADILTKPLQGMAFQTMRSQLMNWPINYEDSSSEPTKQPKRKPVVTKRSVTWGGTKLVPPQTPQECVGQNKPNRSKRMENKRMESKQLGVSRIIKRTCQRSTRRGE
jgi:hypothetical protein